MSFLGTGHMPCKVTYFNVTCHDVTKMFVINLHYITTLHYVLFILYMLCRFVLLTLLHGWPNPVWDDIHFLPTKELLTNYRNLLYIAQQRSQNSGASACFLPFRCVFSFCLFIETTMAPPRVTRCCALPSSDVDSFLEFCLLV